MTQKSSLVYSGKLYVTANDKTFVAHNSASKYLFRLIASILCVENFSSLKLPTYMMLYQTTKDTLIQKPEVHSHKNSELLNRLVDITRYTTDAGDVVESNFISTIYSSMLLSTTYQPAVVTLALVSQDKSEILAAVEFNKDVYDIISKGSQAQLKWVLTISNA